MSAPLLEKNAVILTEKNIHFIKSKNKKAPIISCSALKSNNYWYKQPPDTLTRILVCHTPYFSRGLALFEGENSIMSWQEGENDLQAGEAGVGVK